MTSTRISQHYSEQHSPIARHARRGALVDIVLLAAGIASSLIYVAVDLISAARYPGYEIADQAVSELSAIGAPTAPLWAAMGPAYEVLMIAFGIGVRRTPGANRALRLTGALLIAFGAFGLLWAFVPMHQRGVPMTWTDVGHIVLGAATVPYILVFVGVGASALGRRFRAYSYATFVTLFVAGALTFAMAPRLVAGESTPLLGVFERINVYGYLLWVALLSVALLRRRT